MEKEEERHCVSLVPIFKALDQDDLGKISQNITSRQLAKGKFYIL